MDILRIAAFSYNNKGGNPAGVKICSEMPTENEMLKIAKQVGESAILHQRWKFHSVAMPLLLVVPY